MKVFALLPLLALVLASGPCAFQRHGPDQAIYCSLGRSRDGFDIYCPKSVLNGGWSAPFAFDKPGISVEGKISFPEDDIRLWPLVANVAFYYLVLLGAWRWIRPTLRRAGVVPSDHKAGEALCAAARCAA